MQIHSKFERSVKVITAAAMAFTLMLLSSAPPANAASQPWLPKSTVNFKGNVVTWTATAAGEDSLPLICTTACTCDNTHASTNITVFRATSTGTKLSGDWWKIPAGADCSSTVSSQCLTVALSPGTYIFDPDSAAVATAECRGMLTNP